MQKIFSSFIILLAFVASARDIPTLYFSIDGAENSSLPVDKKNYKNAELIVMYDSVTYDTLSVAVKGRGNSTWRMPKKPLRLKFDKKVSFEGLGKTRNYVLLANYVDPTLLHNDISLWLARQIGLPYSNGSQLCEVYINNIYQGVYELTECIEIAKSSVNISKETGVLLELSKEFDEKYKFRTSRYNLPVMIKDPDLDKEYKKNNSEKKPKEVVKQWQQDLEEALDHVGEDDTFNYFDLESLVAYMLVNDIACNQELSFPKSLFINKEAPGNEYKYTFGPIWDHDVTYNFDTYKDGQIIPFEPTDTLRIHPFLQDLVKTPQFQELYKERLEYVTDSLLPQLLIYIDETAASLSQAAARDSERWPEEYGYKWFYRSPSGQPEKIDQLKEWINRRIEYLQSK